MDFSTFYQRSVFSLLLRLFRGSDDLSVEDVIGVTIAVNDQLNVFLVLQSEIYFLCHSRFLSNLKHVFQSGILVALYNSLRLVIP